jgi:hypothetical protein
LSEADPIAYFARRPASEQAGGTSHHGGDRSSQISPATHNPFAQVCFNRAELMEILSVYGRKVAAGEWRDYAIDMGRDKAVFSVFRRASEFPLYRIEKNPRLARKQGAYSVLTPTGLILKRGSELRRVLAVLEKSVRVVG